MILALVLALQPVRAPDVPTSVEWGNETQEREPDPDPELEPEPEPEPDPAPEPETPDPDDNSLELPPDLSVKAGDKVVITPGAMLQFRYTANVRNRTEQNNATVGFAVVRGRLALKLQLADVFTLFARAGANAGGSFSLERAYGDYNHKNLVHVRAGQFYLPPFAEGNVRPDRLLAADFSPLSNAFEPGASQGAMVSVSPSRWQISLAVTDGLRTGFSEVLSPLAADVAATGHVEVVFLDQGWPRFDDFTSFRGSDPAIRLGAGAHYQTGGRTGSTADLDLLYLAADGQLEGNGWNAFIQGVFTQTNVGDGQTVASGTRYRDWGGLLQAGVFIANPVELFAQGSFVYADGEARLSNPDVPVQHWFRSAVGGLNYYPFVGSHVAKITADFHYMFDPVVGSIVPISSNAGILQNFAGDQFAIRLQWMLTF